MNSLSEIGQLEITGAYPRAIEALEEQLHADPGNIEVVARPGFNLWYVAHEADRMGKGLPVESYRKRFMELLREYREKGLSSGEFCWAFGLGLDLFWHEFPDATETMGPELLSQAEKLDPFWGRIRNGKVMQVELNQRIKDKGIFSRYYQVGDSNP